MFDCSSHELLIVNLEAYGFDKRYLILIYNYRSNRKQRMKINDSFSPWSEILFGVPQGSILGILVFNIFICDMFYFMVNFLLSGKNNLTANHDGNVIESEDNQVLLGVTIDSNLSFNKHINKLCKKASAKVNALARISGYMNLPKSRIIMKPFITSQFGYCPLIWMFHSRTLNNKINFIHERALRITYNDIKSSFEVLLRKDNTLSIQHRNLQLLATEIFKIKNNMAPKILNEIFQNRTSSYNLRKNSSF